MRVVTVAMRLCCETCGLFAQIINNRGLLPGKVRRRGLLLLEVPRIVTERWGFLE